MPLRNRKPKPNPTPHLSQLLGNELSGHVARVRSPLHLPCTSPTSERSGHVAQVAYHAQGYQPPAFGPLPAKARVAMAQKGQVPGYLTLDLTPSLPLSLALSLALPYNPNPNPSPNPITLTLALALTL